MSRDLAAVRKGIRLLLEQNSFRACGEAGDGKEAIVKAKELKSDIVFMDINLPGMNGVNAALRIRHTMSATRTVFLTIHNLPGVADAFRTWADGFVSNAVAGRQLVPLLKRLTDVATGADPKRKNPATGRRD